MVVLFTDLGKPAGGANLAGVGLEQIKSQFP